MSAELRARAEAFLKRPIPGDVQYVPDSFSERFLAAYVAEGKLELDEEVLELFDICVAESALAAVGKTGAEAELFREGAEILAAIRAETAMR